MQIAESHLGLRIMNPLTGEMTDVERPAESAVVFPGYSWDTMYPDSTLSPTEHDVVNVDVSNEGRYSRGQNCARWALIWFSNSTSLVVPTKSDTHT